MSARSPLAPVGVGVERSPELALRRVSVLGDGKDAERVAPVGKEVAGEVVEVSE